MTFYGNGLVWDKELDQRLCKFVNGKFETNDQRTAKILKKMGFKSEGSIKAAEDDEDDKKKKAAEKKASETPKSPENTKDETPVGQSDDKGTAEDKTDNENPGAETGEDVQEPKNLDNADEEMLKKASEADLKALAEKMGLKVAHNIGKGKLLKKILEAKQKK